MSLYGSVKRLRRTELRLSELIWFSAVREAISRSENDGVRRALRRRYPFSRKRVRGVWRAGCGGGAPLHAPRRSSEVRVVLPASSAPSSSAPAAPIPLSARDALSPWGNEHVQRMCERVPLHTPRRLSEVRVLLAFSAAPSFLAPSAPIRFPAVSRGGCAVAQ